MPEITSSQLQANQSIQAADAELKITMDSNSPLSVGAHDFELIVEDDSGNRSAPATRRVIVIDDQAPTAVIDAPNRVSFGEEIVLSGARSVDLGGGKIVRYIWTLLP